MGRQLPKSSSGAVHFGKAFSCSIQETAILGRKLIYNTVYDRCSYARGPGGLTGLVAMICYLPLPAINVTRRVYCLTKLAESYRIDDQPAAPLAGAIRPLVRWWAAAWADIDFYPTPCLESRCLALCCAWFGAT